MTALHAPEQQAVEQARELVAATRGGTRPLALLLGVNPRDPALPIVAAGHATHLLNELVAIIDQLTAGAPR